MKALKKNQFNFPEHWEEHRKYLSLEGCRAVDATMDIFTLTVIYRTDDVQWLVRYGHEGPGHIDLYVLAPAFDNFKALKELIALQASLEKS